MSHAVLAKQSASTPAAKAKAARKDSSHGLRISEPNDVFEVEADRVADEVVSGAACKLGWSLSNLNPYNSLQRKCECGGADECEECRKKKLQRKAGNSESENRNGSSIPSIVHDVLSSPGKQLDRTTRSFMESHFGHDFSGVRVHIDSKAAESAKSVNSLAYTVGKNVVFANGCYNPRSISGQRLLAHELTHVMQQAGSISGDGPLRIAADQSGLEHEANEAGRAVNSVKSGESFGRQAIETPILQRYGSGEHTLFAETGDILKQLVAEKTFVYKVKRGELPKQIATRFDLPEEELRAVNSAKLKHWKSTEDPQKKVEGFEAGEEITIPPVVNEATKEALKNNELTLSVNGVTLPYGEGISMGDFYRSPEDMLNAPPTELQNLSSLIKKKKSGGHVTDADWDAATGKRYSTLALSNDSHFAPSNPSLTTVSGHSPANHKTEWEKHHSSALTESQGGDKNKALATNAFADHFLTDAFAAGHLINKRDVMEKFEGNLPKKAAGDEFADSSVAFFDAVSAASFNGAVEDEFSDYETFDTHYGFHPNINSESRFSTLLQKIHMEEPNLLENATVGGIHDALNEQPHGIPVENAKGNKWNLSGDGTLNAVSLQIGRKAVARSQLNVLEVFKLIGAMDFPTLFKRVWDYVPFPTSKGTAIIKNAVTSGTDPRSSSLIDAIARLIKANYKAIIAELVRRKKLRKA